MALLARLKALGGTLGLLRLEAPGSAAAPAKVTTQKLTLVELAGAVRAEEVRALAELPAELSVPFAKVYEAAGVKPASHGWTVLRLVQLLRTDQFKAMERTAAQKAVLGLLAAERAPVEDVVKDTMGRDQALDAFETYARKKFEERMAARERRVAELESQIRDLQEQRAKVREEAKADEERWGAWVGRKRAAEGELAWGVSYLIDKPVVTIDPASEPP